MGYRDRLSGNEAVAYAMRQINPDVFAAFPITPSTEIPQYFAQYAADGKVDTAFVTVESEHSSMSTCLGAQAAGARAVSATSSAGLAYMYEMLYVVASARQPVTLAVVNRALTGPININCDHSDSMGARDAGWIQIYAENNQEAYDNFLQAMRIGESVRLPVMICQDGFITSHAVENITLEEDASVKAFVGEYDPENYLLKHENPLAVGPYDTCPYYMDHKVQQAHAMMNAKQAILDVAADFEQTFGRKYGLLEEYRMEDAEAALVLIGSTAGTAKACVDRSRPQGGPGEAAGVPPLPRSGAGPGAASLQGSGGPGQERGLFRLRRPGVCRDPFGLLRPGKPPQADQHRLRPGRPGLRRGGYRDGLPTAAAHHRHRRNRRALHPHGSEGGAVRWLTI